MGQTGRKSAIHGLIGFELLIKLACLSFCFPVIRSAIKLCIRVSGYSYITKENLSEILTKPLTLLFLVIAVVFFSHLTLYEMCAVSLALRQKRAGMHVTAAGLTFGGLERTRKLLHGKKSGLLLAVYSMLFVLCVDLPVFLFLLLGLRQTAGTIRSLLKPGMLLLIFTAAFVVWGIAMFGCSIVLMPGIDHGKMDDLKRAWKRLLRSYRRLISGLLKRSVVLVLIESVVYVTGLALMIVAIRYLAPEKTAALVILHSFERFHLIVCVLFITVNAVIYEFFCASLFYEHRSMEKVNQFSEEEIAFADDLKVPGIRRKKYIFFGGITAILLACGFSTFFFFRNGAVLLAEALNTVNVTAHRGASVSAPENTMAAIEQAIDHMADYVEIDIRLTRDGVPILSHDASLYRMTGIFRYVWNMTYEEISQVDVGKKFSPEFEGECIPSLADVFEAYGGDVGFNLDLKPYGDDEVAEKVVALIEEYHLEDSCIITSTSEKVLEQVKELNSGIKTGHILSIVYGDFYKSKAADFFSIRSNFVTDIVVEQAHSVGKEIHAWTVNKENELLRLKTIGVDNIITDDPVLAREVVYNGEWVDTIEEWLNFLLPRN